MLIKLFLRRDHTPTSRLNSCLFGLDRLIHTSVSAQKGKETVHRFPFSCPPMDGTSDKTYADLKKRKGLG